MSIATHADAIAELAAQPVLQPGEPGWWKVWGATPYHVEAGDILIARNGDALEVLFVEDTFTAKSYPMRVGFVVDGEKTTIGAGVPIVLMRRGTKNTLRAD